MSTVMRAQVSLMFDDADLFENFIVPCKEERRLNGIIVKCLAAYYTDARVRNLVEGVTPEEESQAEGVASTQSICDSIRASLVMQDYLVEELKQTVETGMDDIADVLHKANQSAVDRGVGAEYKTKSGSTILQLEPPKQKSGGESQSMVATAPASAPDGLASVLVQAVMLLAKDAGNPQVTAMLQQVMGSGGAVAPTISEETPRQVVDSEVGSSVSTGASDFDDDTPVVEMDTENDFDTGKPSEPVPAEPEPEDALAAMKDLFGSL